MPSRCTLLIFVVAAISVLGVTNVCAQDDTVPAFEAVDSIQARTQGCVTCHGQEGRGTGNGYYPRIAGKPARYLANQLMAFRDGTRRYVPMNELVAYLPDSYLREMADYFAAQRPAFQPHGASTLDAAAIARGRTIATAGDDAMRVPACIACHGAGLTGMQPGIPGLVGLGPAYVAAQLTRWRLGDRHAAEPDCMKRIAMRLTDADVAAVAGWLSQQPAPVDAAPESSNLVRMPLSCGSKMPP